MYIIHDEQNVKNLNKALQRVQCGVSVWGIGTCTPRDTPRRTEKGVQTKCTRMFMAASSQPPKGGSTPCPSQVSGHTWSFCQAVSFGLKRERSSHTPGSPATLSAPRREPDSGGHTCASPRNAQMGQQKGRPRPSEDSRTEVMLFCCSSRLACVRLNSSPANA